MSMQYYWEELGLLRDPFQDGSNHAFLKIEEWDNYYDLLKHLVKYSNSIKLITGEIGVGKTTFVKNFKRRCEHECEIFYLVANTNWKSADYVFEIARQLQLSNNNYEVDWWQKTITEYIFQHKTHYLFIIDNAHDLSDEELVFFTRWLSVLPIEDPKLHFFFIGHLALITRLQTLLSDTEYRQFIRVFKLNPLTLSQIKAYLESLLLAAGYQGKEEIFINKAIKDIFNVSNGTFSKIQQIARTTLMEQVMKKKNICILINKYKTFLILSAVFLGVLSLVLLNHAKIKPVSDRADIVDLVAETDDNQAIDINLEKTIQATKDSVEFLSQPQEEPKVLQQNDTDIVLDNAQAISNQNSHESTDLISIDTPEHMEQTISSSDKQEDILAAHHYSNFTQASAEDVEGYSIDDFKEMKKQVTEKSNKNSPIEQIEKEILLKKGSLFTIQLTAVHSENVAKKYIKTHQLMPAYYFRTQSKGKTLYAIIYGEYATEYAAQSSLKRLSAKIKNKPSQYWVRKYSDVHKIIKKNKTPD